MKSGKVRIGVIGAGWWASSNHIPVLKKRDDVELAAVCRIGMSELKRLQDEFGFEYITEDYQKLLSEVQLDGVVVASPHTLHYEHATAALEAGCHVMCEKPLTTNADDARDLVARAKDKNLTLMIPHGWHYKPYIQEAKRRMDAGVVGKIEAIHCQQSSPIVSLLRGQEFIHGEMFFKPDKETWADPKVAGGGYGLANLTHALGMLFLLTDLKPSNVYARTTSPGAEVEINIAISAEFEVGAIGTIFGTAFVPDQARFQVDVRVYGTEGMLMVDMDRARMDVQRFDGDDFLMELDLAAGVYSCEGPPNNFVDLILGVDDTCWAPGEVGMRAIEVLDAAYRSAQSGRPESV